MSDWSQPTAEVVHRPTCLTPLEAFELVYCNHCQAKGQFSAALRAADTSRTSVTQHLATLWKSPPVTIMSSPQIRTVADYHAQASAPYTQSGSPDATLPSPVAAQLPHCRLVHHTLGVPETAASFQPELS